MSRKRWVPVTGELVLQTLDDNSGLTFPQLESTLGLVDVAPGKMALISAIIQLAEVGLVQADGINERDLSSMIRENMSAIVYPNFSPPGLKTLPGAVLRGGQLVWRTTVLWMRTREAITTIQLGAQREKFSFPMFCYPVFGRPSDHLSQTDIFVVMPFAEQMRPVYDDHLVKVAAGLSLTIARADDFYTNSSLIMDIWSAIHGSSIVVADCTGRNPNVFYELGMAHTVGVPVVMISQDERDIPSDLRHLRYYLYDYTPRGMLQLEENVRRVVSALLKL